MFDSYVISTAAKALLLILAVVVMIGAWMIASSFIPGPNSKTRKAMKNYRNSGKAKGAASAAANESFKAFTKKYAKFVHLTPIEKAEQEKALLITGSTMTPEEFTAYIWVKNGLFVVMGLIIFGLSMLAKYALGLSGNFAITVLMVLGLGFMVMGIFVLIKDKRSLKKDHRVAIESIEGELPRFVSYLKLALATSNSGILALLEGYKSYDEKFAAELSQTIADAKTSNFTGAMARWDQRYNSERLKMVIHGLISANNGDDVRIYFNMLERDFTNYEVTMLKRKVKSIPNRMRIPKLLMYTSVFLTLFYPIVCQVIDSFKEVFMNSSYPLFPM